MVQCHDQLEGSSQKGRTAETSLLGKEREMVVSRVPQNGCSDLVELFQPGWKHPLSRSVHLGLLGNGADCKVSMICTHPASHNSMNIGWLPTVLPDLVDLTAEVRADQSGDDSRRDARRLADPFGPPSGECSQLYTGLVSLANLELFEDLDEHVLDPIIRLDRLGPCSGLRRRLQSGTEL